MEETKDCATFNVLRIKIFVEIPENLDLELGFNIAHVNLKVRSVEVWGFASVVFTWCYLLYSFLQVRREFPLKTLDAQKSLSDVQEAVC